jgi:predicted nucleic acid-binding Zn ribbon protein
MHRKTNQQTIGEVLQEIIAAYRLRPQMNQAKLAADWERLVGKTIARHTTNLYLKDGILQVSLNSAPLRNELFFARNEVKQHLNEVFGEGFVSEIVVK